MIQVWQPSFPQRKGMFNRNSTDLIETASLFSMGEIVSCRCEIVGGRGL